MEEGFTPRLALQFETGDCMNPTRSGRNAATLFGTGAQEMMSAVSYRPGSGGVL